METRPGAIETRQRIFPDRYGLPATAEPGHIVVPENTKGWSYRRLFAEYLKGARQITVKIPIFGFFFKHAI